MPKVVSDVDGPKVIFDANDIHIGCIVAKQRRAYHDKRRTKQRAKAKRSSMQIKWDLIGALSELAVAVWSGIPRERFWPYLRREDYQNITVDVPPHWQVRSTAWMSDGAGLLVYPYEAERNAAYRYVLVSVPGSFQYAWLRGWLYGREAAQPKFWKEEWPNGSKMRDPAYMPTEKDLRSMEDEG